TPEARFQVYDAVVRLLAHASKSAPIVVLLDDLQWADRSSLSLLQFFSREAKTTRLLVVCSYRDLGLSANEALERTVGALLRETPFAVRLEGFSTDDIGRFLELALGRVPVAATRDALARKTGGNPLFLTQLLQLARAQGIAGDDLDLDALRVPSGMQDAI